MKYAIITDIHEDIVNLRLAFAKIEKLACDEVICLGDISGFSVPHYQYYNTRNASECLRMVRENCKIIVTGNHDLHAARITPKINPDFEYPENWYQLDYQEKLELSEGRLWLYDNDELNPLYKQTDIEFLKKLPEFHVLESSMGNVFLSHFIYPNLTGVERSFYDFFDEMDRHRTFVNNANCFFSFAGHRHFAGLLVASAKRMIEKRFNTSYAPQSGNCIMVPPITGKKIGNGFCVWDDVTGIVKAVRI